MMPPRDVPALIPRSCDPGKQTSRRWGEGMVPACQVGPVASQGSLEEDGEKERESGRCDDA